MERIHVKRVAHALWILQRNHLVVPKTPRINTNTPPSSVKRDPVPPRVPLESFVRQCSVRNRQRTLAARLLKRKQ